MTLRTQQNLSVGMHGEAFASAKYKRFAAFARTRQNGKLAALMTQAADDSRIGHFAQELQLAGLISDDIGNLQDVIQDTLDQAERYRRFAREAQEDGDDNAAALFKGLADDDQGWILKFKTALLQYQVKT